MTQVHKDFGSSSDTYSSSQGNENVSDGDVLVCSDGVVGFLFEAWPVAVTATRGSFHTLSSHPKDIKDAKPCHAAGYEEARKVALSLSRALRKEDWEA